MKRYLAMSLCLVALSVMAESFEDGWSLMYQKEFEKAERIFRELDKQGDRNGTFGLGVMHMYGYGTVPKNYDTAMSLYQEAAKANIPAAMHNIAFLYQHGLGVDANLTEAVHWYTKAANLGFTTSQHDLAAMYYKGAGVKKNDKTAFSLYKQAADGGLVDALYAVGEMYAQGVGTQRDYALAYAYIKSAKLLGVEVDLRALAWLEVILPGPELEKANEISAGLIKKNQHL